MVSDWKNLAAISINSSSKITFSPIVKAMNWIKICGQTENVFSVFLKKHLIY